MIYLLHGKDTFRSRQKLNELLDFFRSKTENLSIFQFEGEKFDQPGIEELMKAQSLFEKKCVVVCKNFLGNKTAEKFALENIENFSRSQNIFIFLEKEMEKEQMEVFKKRAEKVQHFGSLSGARLRKWIQDETRELDAKADLNDTEEIAKKCGANLWCASQEIEKRTLGKTQQKRAVSFQTAKPSPFAVCDAIGTRSGKKAWIILQQAVLAGTAAEEVFWKAVWQIKIMLLIKKLSANPNTNIAQKSGLHPFVVKKNLSSLRNFTEGELSKMSSKLTKIYHQARRGSGEISTDLEKFLLEM